MCDPVTMGVTMATTQTGLSIFGNTKANKRANKIARAQAAAAKEQYYNNRVRTELNYGMDLERLEEVENIADRKNAAEESDILMAIGDKQPMGNSTSKIFQSVVAENALDLSAIATSKQNRRRQAVSQFADNKGKYLGTLQDIRNNLNKNFKSGEEIAMEGLGAGVSGFMTGYTIGSAFEKGATSTSSNQVEVEGGSTDTKGLF